MLADSVVPRARQIVLATKGGQKVPRALPGSEMPRPGFLFTEAQGCWVQKTGEGRTRLLPCPFLRAQASQASLGFGELVPAKATASYGCPSQVCGAVLSSLPTRQMAEPDHHPSQP